MDYSFSTNGKVLDSGSITTLNSTSMHNLQNEITLTVNQTSVSNFLRAKNSGYVYLNASTQATWNPEIKEQDKSFQTQNISCWRNRLPQHE